MGDTANVLVGIASIAVGTDYTFRRIGYTTDGVIMTVRSSFADVKVEENEGSIIRKLTDQEILVTLNVAEGLLANLEASIPGSSLLLDVLTLGGTVLQEKAITLVGKAPGAPPTNERLITLTKCNPTGEVALPYKKGEISIVPVTFSALVADPVPPALSGLFGAVEDAVPALLTGLTENLAASFVPAFATATLDYTLAATNLEAAVTITATFAGATLTFYDPDHPTGSVVASGAGHVVNLAVGVNIIVIKVVKATLGTRHYRIVVTRA